MRTSGAISQARAPDQRTQHHFFIALQRASHSLLQLNNRTPIPLKLQPPRHQVTQKIFDFESSGGVTDIATLNVRGSSTSVA
ncbi:hypothetical protein GFL15_23075 [Rhizobium leguminosarum bv. viciae]|nr:hypothetical protein [Rhizobium leguminosarum bv. viciae]